MSPEIQEQLIAAACTVRDRAYAKYSGFLVGAAIRAKRGAVFTGCNVENGSYGLTICAERAAVFAAVAAGERRFEMLAIASDGGVPPCGACRQVLAEFCDDLPILIVDVNRPGEFVTTKLSELLPNRFQFTRGANRGDV